MVQPWLVILLLATTLMSLSKAVPGEYPVETIDKKPGETVRLNCSTRSLSSADWSYRKRQEAESVSIYIGNSRGGGKISNSYKSRTRYSVYEDIANGTYDLIIQDVTKSDEGIYTCSETSDPDISTSTHLIILEDKLEDCPYDEAAITGEFVQLRFHTTQSDSIHIEHRSTDRSYPLHVFRDGKIVNDYYVLSGRFGFYRSDETWNLLMKNIQLSDAGTYIFSEDNGLGKQYTKELVVLDKTVSFEFEGETCTNNEVFEANVTCAANFSGHCPPRLQLRRAADDLEGESKVLNNSVFVTSPTNVRLRTVVSGDDLGSSLHLFCAVATQNSYIVLAHGKETTSSCSDACKVNTNTGIILAVVITCLLLFIVVTTTVLIVFKCMKRKPASTERSTNQNLLHDGQEMQSIASAGKTDQIST